MRIPTLENVYQTLEQQHQILMKEKAKINKIKNKIGVRDSSPSKIKYSYSNTDNMYDIYLEYLFFFKLKFYLSNELINRKYCKFPVKQILLLIQCYH